MKTLISGEYRTLEMSSKKLYRGIDVFKLIAAFGVVAVHTGINFLNTLGRIGIPFFVIISSFFFFQHYFKLSNAEKRKEYVKKFVKRLCLLFLTWEFFYIPLAVREYVKINFERGFTIKTLLVYVFDFFYPVPSNANGWGPSWYLIAMCMALPIFISIFYLLRKNWVILGIFCVLIEIYYIGANGYGFLTHWSTLGTYGFPRVFIYIYIGMLIAKFRNKINEYSFKKCFGCFSSILILFLIENFIIGILGGVFTSEEVVTTAPTALVGSLVAIKWQPNIANTVNARNFSTFLYCAQQWEIVVWRSFIHIFSITFLETNLIEFMFVVISSYIFYLLYRWIRNKTKWKFWTYMV